MSPNRRTKRVLGLNSLTARKTEEEQGQSGGQNRP